MLIMKYGAGSKGRFAQRIRRMGQHTRKARKERRQQASKQVQNSFKCQNSLN